MAWAVGRAGGSDAGEAGRGYLRQDSEGDARGPPLDAQGALDRQPELDVERVAPVARDDVREDRTAEERQVADEVEDLVPDELVAVAQAVERAAVREHDRVVERAAAREAVLPHEPEVLEEPVGARRGDVLDEGALRGGGPGQDPRGDGRVIRIARVADAERWRGEDVDPAPVAPDAGRVGQRERPSARRLLIPSGGGEQRD